MKHSGWRLQGVGPNAEAAGDMEACAAALQAAFPDFAWARGGPKRCNAKPTTDGRTLVASLMLCFVGGCGLLGSIGVNLFFFTHLNE